MQQALLNKKIIFMNFLTKRCVTKLKKPITFVELVVGLG
jgi:hypothetical protein